MSLLEVKRSVRLSISIKIRKDCTVVFNVPFWVSQQKIMEVAEKHMEWIFRKVQECKSRPILYYINTWPIRGYKVTVHKTKDNHIVYTSISPHIHVPKTFFRSKREFYTKIVDFYKSEIKEDIHKYVRLYTRKLRQHYNKVTIRQSETRWGSCSSKKNLNFSYRLGLVPTKLLKYVVAHEVAHLKHMNHSKRFWQTVEILYPQYKKARKALRKWEGVRLV